MITVPQFRSYSRFLRSKESHNVYAWCVFVDSDRGGLAEIREIEYTLHPSFPNPVHTVNDAATCFALQSSGWGEFQVRIRTTAKNGSVFRSAFFLRLEKAAWPLGTAPSIPSSSADAKILDALNEVDWEWRKLSTLARKAGASEDFTRSRLEELEKVKAVRRAYFLSIDDQTLWGATSRVGLLPVPSERDVRRIERP